jgi:Uma2 family endonuclease
MARRHEIMFEENTESIRIPADAHTFEGFWRWVESDEFPRFGRIDFLGGEIDIDLGPETGSLRIPADAHTYEGFLRWLESDEFPETGRIDFLAGEIYADMSPEDVGSHGVVKVAISTALQILISEQDRGEVYSDRTRITLHPTGLAVEPDAVVALWETFERGRLRHVPPAAGDHERIVAVEGAPDLVVEIISPSSVQKDTKRLPREYAAAGIPELWLVDARGSRLQFQIHTLREGRYVPIPPDTEGWALSPVLGGLFRLVRHRTRMSTWRYVLEHRAS